MKSTAEVGMKVSAGQREYYRYAGESAELERRGAGSSRAALAWIRRLRLEGEGDRPIIQSNSSNDKEKQLEKKA